MIGASYAAEKSMGRMFPEKELLDIVKSHAKWGAIAIAIPFIPVADVILYVIVLWHMYHKLSEASNRSLKIGLGIIVNFVVAIGIGIADEALDWIPVIGWLFSALIVYIQFYFSGRAYVSYLKEFYSK
ncbi:MAG: hypothetical protein MJZ14_08735 [Paludibacteraceae bacterium]|nr:hypothetical protein [Paludibacteraceae bacterium]